MSLLSPQDRVTANAAAIKAVAEMVKKHYIVRVQGRVYLAVAGAQAVATSMGYTTAIESLRYVPATDGLPGYWEAIATVQDGGVVVGRGIGSVFDNESPWNKRAQFARQAMAQTRATGRALKGVMGWATGLLGAETSLHEEMADRDATMPQEASEEPRRLPAPKAVPTQQGGNGARWVTAVVAAVENHRTGETAWWKIITEGEDGKMDTWTCFKPKGAKETWTPESLIGKRADLKLETKTRKDGTAGVVVVDAIDSSELPV